MEVTICYKLHNIEYNLLKFGLDYFIFDINVIYITHVLFCKFYGVGISEPVLSLLNGYEQYWCGTEITY